MNGHTGFPLCWYPLQVGLLCFSSCCLLRVSSSCVTTVPVVLAVVLMFQGPNSDLTGKVQNTVFHEGSVYLFLLKEQPFLRNSGMEEKGEMSSLVGTTPTAASSMFLHLDVPCLYNTHLPRFSLWIMELFSHEYHALPKIKNRLNSVVSSINIKMITASWTKCIHLFIPLRKALLREGRSVSICSSRWRSQAEGLDTAGHTQNREEESKGCLLMVSSLLLFYLSQDLSQGMVPSTEV